MKKQMNTLFGLLAAGILLMSGCANNTATMTAAPSNNQIDPSKSLTAYFIDVGQADACLLEYNGRYMVIDGGNNADEQRMVDFLNSKGVKQIDYVVGTHPDADHIGGLDAVIENFDVLEVAMPQVASNTRTFADVLTAVEEKGLSIHAPEAGTSFSFNGIPVEVLGPVKEYEDSNNNSIALKMTYQNVSTLFTGDIETQAEGDIVNQGYNLKADVLKVAHHGSETSSTQAFLDAVDPTYAIISCGTDNKYGHPHKKTLNRLNKMGVEYYRTDQYGTIEMVTDGNNVAFQFEHRPTVDNAPASESTTYYIGNQNSNVYHDPSCGSLPSEKNRVTFETEDNAAAAGFTPCSRCLGE